MATLTDARVLTLQGHFNTGDQPSEANFADLIQWIQEGIEEHQHDGTGDGDGSVALTGVLMADDAWVGRGAALGRLVFDANGVSIMGAQLGIGTLAQVAGFANMIVWKGPDASNAGPHIQISTDLDAYPVFQMVSWSHDSIEMIFDGYLDAVGYKSSDAGSSFRLLKGTDEFHIEYDVAAAGAAITWNIGFAMDKVGDVWFPKLAGVGVRNVSADANGKLVIA